MTYEIVKELASYTSGNVTRESHLVRVDDVLVCRETKTLDLYFTNFVIVEALRIFDDGITYEETHVVASDEDGTINDAVLYLSTRALTVPEAMFSLGEHNFIEPTDTTQEDTNA